MRRFYMVKDSGTMVIIREEVGGQRWLIPRSIWRQIEDTQLASEEYTINNVLRRYGRKI